MLPGCSSAWLPMAWFWALGPCSQRLAHKSSHNPSSQLVSLQLSWLKQNLRIEGWFDPLFFWVAFWMADPSQQSETCTTELYAEGGPWAHAMREPLTRILRCRKVHGWNLRFLLCEGEDAVFTVNVQSLKMLVTSGLLKRHYWAYCNRLTPLSFSRAVLIFT